MWRGILAAVLIVGALIGARQCSKAQQDTRGNEQAEASSNEEAEICRGKDSFTYEIDGKRYSLPFEVIDDQAVVEGDIVFGQAADVNGGTNSVAPAVPDYIHGEPRRWEGNLVPYIIDASVSASDRALIQQAITAWQRDTNVRFRQLSGARDWKRENYVKFSGQKNQCSSNSLGIKEELSGKVNEDDNINVVQVAGCGQNWGRIAHEIGHVLGLGHEHSRGHRDDYITILWGNIDGPKQFCRVIWDQPALASTAYDYDSITHYAPTRAAKRSSDCKKVIYDGREDCLAFLPNQEKLEQQRQKLGTNIKPGQRDHLSAGDIARVNTLYPASSPDASPAPPRSQNSITEPRPVRPLCCRDRGGGDPFCRPAACPTVRVRWPQPDRWCRPRSCRPWPRRHCDGWFEARWDNPPFDDWDDRW
jgi:Astacin (Peptidase family M12A)